MADIDFSRILTLENIKKWGAQRADLVSLDLPMMAYRFDISRPSWLKAKKGMCCEDIEAIVFTGKTHEEIFIKMYEKCLNSLVWKGGKRDGKKADLLDYFLPYTEVLTSIIRPMGDQRIIFRPGENESFAGDGSESDGDDYDSSPYQGFVVINDANKEKYESLIIQYIIYDKLDFYGFTGNGCDCCFQVTELEML